MKTQVLIALSASLLTLSAQASTEDPKLVQKLKDAKFTLLDAIAQAEYVSGPAISAKFELDGDHLVYSVYTAPQGIDQAPEDVPLSEISGPATQLPIVLATEIFADKAHIARASSHLTLMQISRLSLREVIQKAFDCSHGFAYSVKNPTVRDHRPVADVSMLKSDGTVAIASINLATGAVQSCAR